jgi:hypothetical protein
MLPKPFNTPDTSWRRYPITYSSKGSERKSFSKAQNDKDTTTTTDSYHSYLPPPPPPPPLHRDVGVEQTFTPKATKIYHVDYEVARDFARFCHYLDPPMSASQGVEEAMQYYMMVKQKDLVCTAQFVVKPIVVEAKEPERVHCEIKGCKEPVEGQGVWRGKDVYALCATHLAEAKASKQWKVTKP